MKEDFRKLVLDRARQELAAVSQKCLQAIDAIDRDSGSSVVEAVLNVEELGEKLECALNRLLVLRDAEQDVQMTPYLLEPSPSALQSRTQNHHV